MTGSDNIKVPSQSRELGKENGNKKVSDLISNDVSISWEGTSGTPTGTVKYISNYGKPYEGEQVSGHFFPTKFERKYFDKEIQVGGEGGKTIIPTEDDPYLIIRIENVTVENKISAVVKDDATKIFELNFGEIKREAPKGKDAFNADKTDYGNFGNNSTYYEGGKVNITWRDTKAIVTGKLKWLGTEQLEPFSKLSKEGYYFAFSLSKWFNGKIVEVDNGGKTHSAADTDWVCNVADKNKPIVVKRENTVVATYDLSGVELGKKTE